MSTLETCSTWGVLVNRGFTWGTFPTCRKRLTRDYHREVYDC